MSGDYEKLLATIDGSECFQEHYFHDVCIEVNINIISPAALF